jgi:hypothetical protein
MATEQNRCAETQRLLGGSSLQLAFRLAGAQRLAGDVSTGVFHPIVPQNFLKDIFAHFHNISHPGRLPSRRMVSSRFVWRGLASGITTWSQACLHCQQAKIHRHTCLQPKPVPIPQRCFSHLHIDLVGPLQYSGGFNFIFAVIDRTSKWMEAVPLFDMSTVACAKALLFSWISRLGVPETIISDRGTQFTANIWSQLCEMLHISHLQTTAYCQTVQSRLHSHLKDALRTCAAAATWSEELPFVLLGLRAQPRENTLDAPPFSLPRHNSSVHLLVELLRAPFVWLRCSNVMQPLPRPYNGP